MDPNQQPPAQQNPMPQQPISKIPSSGSKWKLILLIVILLVIVGSGTYYLGTRQNKLIVQNRQKQIIPTTTQSSPTPTPDLTTNWKTYVNTHNFYSFLYPDTLFTVQENGLRTRLFKGMGYSFEINVIQTTDTIENWLIKEKNNGQFPDSNWKSIQSTFQNHPALFLQSLPNTMQVAMDVFIVKNNNMIYEISFSKEASEKTIVDQILSTFKFTDQTAVDKNTGITGQVTLSPTCTGAQKPGEVCSKPYSAQFQTQTGVIFQSDNDGLFRINIPPGEYTITKINNASNYPACKPVNINVTQGSYINISISCDTGIR